MEEASTNRESRERQVETRGDREGQLETEKIGGDREGCEETGRDKDWLREKLYIGNESAQRTNCDLVCLLFGGIIRKFGHR